MQPKYAISTRDGQFFDYNNPSAYRFDIEVIAHALSNLCRYGGHSDRFYSVAEHSVLVSRVVPPELALCGLLHDASEAFVGDMPSPLKAMCQSYRTIEGKVQEAIARYYSLPYPFPSEVHLADKMLYKAEREQIVPIPDLVWHTDILAANVEIRGLKPGMAKTHFIARYRELTAPSAGGKTEHNENNQQDKKLLCA